MKLLKFVGFSSAPPHTPHTTPPKLTHTTPHKKTDIYTAYILVIALNFLRVIFQTPQIYKKSAAIYVVICNKTYLLKLFDSQNPT